MLGVLQAAAQSHNSFEQAFPSGRGSEIRMQMLSRGDVSDSEASDTETQAHRTSPQQQKVCCSKNESSCNHTHACLHQRCANRMIAVIVLAANTCLVAASTSMSTAYLQRKSARLGQGCLSAHVPMYAHVADLGHAHLSLLVLFKQQARIGV